MSIELDGNGNSVRRDPVVVNSDLAKQIRSVGRGQIEQLKTDILLSLSELQENRADVSRSAALSCRYAIDIVEANFNELLSKFKD